MSQVATIPIFASFSLVSPRSATVASYSGLTTEIVLHGRDRWQSVPTVWAIDLGSWQLQVFLGYDLPLCQLGGAQLTSPL